MFAEQIRPFVKNAYVTLGTDGFGVPTPARSCAISSRSTVTGSPGRAQGAGRRRHDRARQGCRGTGQVQPSTRTSPTRCRLSAEETEKMSQLIEVKVPDIGDFDEVPVIELFVKVGDTIAVDDAIATSSPTRPPWTCRRQRQAWSRGSADQRRRQGCEGSAADQGRGSRGRSSWRRRRLRPHRRPPPPAPAAAPAARPRRRWWHGRSEGPDIGDFDEVPVIELFVKVGDTIKVDDAICTLESDKATMDVPSRPPAWSRKSSLRSATRSPKARAVEGRSRGCSGCGASPGRRRSRAGAGTGTGGSPAPAPAKVASAPARRPRRRVTLGGKVHASPSVRALPANWASICPGQGHRSEEPHPQGRHHCLRQGAMQSGVVPGKAGGRCGGRQPGWRAGPAAVAEGRFLQVRRNRVKSRCRASRRSPARTSPATGR